MNVRVGDIIKLENNQFVAVSVFHLLSLNLLSTSGDYDLFISCKQMVTKQIMNLMENLTIHFYTDVLLLQKYTHTTII